MRIKNVFATFIFALTLGLISDEKALVSAASVDATGKKVVQSQTVTTYNTYKVVKKDTLYAIGKRFSVTVDAIKKANGLKNNTIRIGQSLKIPAKTTAKVATKTSTQTATKTTTAVKTTQQAKSSKKEFTVVATAYTATCKGCSGITRTGINLKKNPHLKVISVDPKIIPLGSKVWVEGYGEAIAGDTGGAIKGNMIDVFIPDKNAVKKWGRKTVKVKIL